jgi:NAD(P)-dependent dehydrogenase (short-subunit alcohol dehydrogenase family)
MADMTPHFTGRTAVIIGAGSRLGFAIARELHARGARVWIAGPELEICRRDAGKLDGARAVQLDVTDFSSCQRALQSIGADSPVDVLVNCAAVSNHSPLPAGNFTDWERTIDVSLTGAMRVLGAAAPVMARAPVPGAILTISSLNGEIPVPGYAAYCAAKAGVGMLTRVAALELAPVRVNAVAPGPVEQPSKLFEQFPAFLDGLKQRHILGPRLTTPGDVANACLFLLGPESGWITGQTLVIDGGIGLNYGSLPHVSNIARELGGEEDPPSEG